MEQLHYLPKFIQRIILPAQVQGPMQPTSTLVHYTFVRTELDGM